MEKKFNKEQISLYLEAEDQEIREAAFGYLLRNIVNNDYPMFQMAEVLYYKEKILEKTTEDIIVNIGKQLNDEKEIQRFIQMSYWFQQQPLYICKILEVNHNSHLEKSGLEILAQAVANVFIPKECYQYLIEQTTDGNKKAQDILSEMLYHHPDTELEPLLHVMEQRTSSTNIPFLISVVKQNDNEKNLLPLVKFIKNCCYKNIYDAIELKKLFSISINHYIKTPIISYELFRSIFSVLEQINVDNDNWKKFCELLFCRIDDENPLIREKKVDLLKKFVAQTKDYQFVIKLLSQNINNTLLKRVILLIIHSFMVQISKKQGKENASYVEYKNFVLKFIKAQGAKFDKSDFEYVNCILNLNKDDKEYQQSIMTELLASCQKTSIQIDCLLHYAALYKQHSIMILELIDWNGCQLTAPLLSRLLFNYKNSKKTAEIKTYLTIFEQLSKCDNIPIDTKSLLAEKITKISFSEKQLIEYPNIANKIKWYKERQQLLEALNN